MTVKGSFESGNEQFLSTLSLRRATQLNLSAVFLAQISIHALLAESDDDGVEGMLQAYISIHALLAESDTDTIRKTQRPYVFLSTLSLRRAT